MLKTVVAAAVVASFVLAVGAMPSETRATDASVKISGRVLRDTAGGGTASIVVYLRDQADLSRAYAMRDQNARGWYVYRTLKAHAARTQAPLRKWLEEPSRAVPLLLGGEHDRQPRRPRAREQARRAPGRAADRVGTRVRGAAGRAAAAAEPRSTRSRRRRPPSARTAGVEWGVNDVHAPALWSLGFTGQGMVVASADTGVRWTHSALKSHYRGWNGTAADHNYNWHDAIHSGGGACGANSVQPCDDSAHGTHTTGTVVGDDGAGNQIGVAPRREVDRLPQHGSGHGQPGDVHRVLPVVHRADRPRRRQTPIRRSAPMSSPTAGRARRARAAPPTR